MEHPELWSECLKQRTTQVQPMPSSARGICSSSRAQAGCSALLPHSEHCAVSLNVLRLAPLQWSWVESGPSEQYCGADRDRAG